MFMTLCRLMRVIGGYVFFGAYESAVAVQSVLRGEGSAVSVLLLGDLRQRFISAMTDKVHFNLLSSTHVAMDHEQAHRLPRADL